MQRYINSLILALILLCLNLFSFLPAFADESNKTFHLGALLTLTGDYAMQGNAFREGIELALDEINKNGGVNKIPLEVEIENSEYSGAKANLAAKKLATSKDLLGVIISTLHESKAASPELLKLGIPILVLWDSAPELEKLGRGSFGIDPWAPSTGGESARFAREDLKAKNAAIIGNHNEWSDSVSETFENEFKKMGGTIVYQESLIPGEQDFRTYLTKIRALNADVVYAPITDNLTAFFNQARQLDLKMPLITSDNINDELLSAEPRAYEGVYHSQVPDPEAPATERMRTLYKAKYGRDCKMLMYVAWAYDSVRLFAHAIEKSGPNRAAITNFIYGIRDFPGASAKITFNDRGSAPIMVKMHQVRKGKQFKVK